MKPNRKERFQRSSRNRNTRELILIAAEGAVTEKSYIEAVIDCFKIRKKEISGEEAKISYTFVGYKNQSAPLERLRRLKRKISDDGIDDNFSAWLICDVDEWGKDQFDGVTKWLEKDTRRRHWILNSPNFEHWLSFHFTNHEERRAYFNRYNKRVKKTDFGYEQIVAACKRAREVSRNVSSLFEQEGSEMFLLIEYIAKNFGLENDFE